ncbi:MAG: hypothetical protein MMC23_008202 [Stictis urceolatum]|nr:hypothetical protein [Stictis urceolata]
MDLSSLPPLIQPSPPSNTLLITALTNPQIFTPATLATIRQHLSSPTPLHSFSPLKSLRRIIISYPTTEAAIELRKALDGTDILGCRARIYFGEPTPIEVKDQHLPLPESNKLFFISPPPSPPHGWEMRNEEPPNKAVHADDLASALKALRAKNQDEGETMKGLEGEGSGAGEALGRARSGSTTLVYRPEEHGGRSGLPAVTVEDTSEGEEGGEDKKIMAHTARPPVELME